MQTMHQYEVVGRAKPTEKVPHPKVYRMKLFATNRVTAGSRFWYFLSLLKKVKRQVGEIVEIHEIFDTKPAQVKNYAVWLRYDSRSGTHNMYKEFRDTTLTGAIDQLYADMAARHRARRRSIQIIKTATIASAQCKRANLKQFQDPNIKFRLLHRIPRPALKKYRTTFRATAPSTFF